MTRRLVVAAVAALGLAGCGTGGVSGARVQRAVATTFTNLYVRQQQLLGHPGLSTTWVGGQADCARRGAGGAGAAAEGPGDDWDCRIRWRSWDGTPMLATYDLEVRASGCYTATAATAASGGRALRTADGRDVPNPIFQFDGCFDTG